MVRSMTAKRFMKSPRAPRSITFWLKGNTVAIASAWSSPSPTSARARIVGSRLRRFVTRSAWLSLTSRVEVSLNTRSLSSAVVMRGCSAISTSSAGGILRSASEMMSRWPAKVLASRFSA